MCGGVVSRRFGKRAVFFVIVQDVDHVLKMTGS